MVFVKQSEEYISFLTDLMSSSASRAIHFLGGVLLVVDVHLSVHQMMSVVHPVVRGGQFGHPIVEGVGTRHGSGRYAAVPVPVLV